MAKFAILSWACDLHTAGGAHGLVFSSSVDKWTGADATKSSARGDRRTLICDQHRKKKCKWMVRTSEQVSE